jgi:hypothetical protein
MLPGQKHFARDGKWLADTISMIGKSWPKTGVAVYFYKYLTDEQVAAVKHVPFQRMETPLHSAGAELMKQ